MKTLDLRKSIESFKSIDGATNVTISICPRINHPYQDYDMETVIKRDNKVMNSLLDIVSKSSSDVVFRASVSYGSLCVKLGRFGSAVNERAEVGTDWVRDCWSLICGELDWPESRTVSIGVSVNAILDSGFFRLWYEPAVLSNPKVSMGNVLKRIQNKVKPGHAYVSFGMYRLMYCSVFFDMSDRERIVQAATEQCVWPDYYV